MEDKKSFVLYKNWGDFVTNMTDEEAGQLLKAIYALEVNGEDITPENRVAALIFDGIKGKLIEDIEGYAKTCNKRSENAKKRWNDAKGVQEDATGMQKHANASTCIKRKCKPIQKDGDTDTDTDTDTENETDTEKDGVSPIVPFSAMTRVSRVEEDDLQSLGVPAELCEQVSEWIENRDAKGETLTEAELKSFVSRVKVKTKEYGPQAVADLIGESMSNGYKGVTWDRLDRNRGKPKNAYIDRIDHRMDVVDEWARSVGAYEEGS